MYTYIHTHIFTHTHIYIYICTHIYTYIHTHVYIYIYTRYHAPTTPQEGEGDSTTPPPHHMGGKGTVLRLTHDHGGGGWNAGPYIYILKAGTFSQVTRGCLRWPPAPWDPGGPCKIKKFYISTDGTHTHTYLLQSVSTLGALIHSCLEMSNESRPAIRNLFPSAS